MVFFHASIVSRRGWPGGEDPGRHGDRFVNESPRVAISIGSVIEPGEVTHTRRHVGVIAREHASAHPLDRDDSEYVNLAIVADAKLIVSRDKHLLGLNDAAKPWAREFQERFPDIRVMEPAEFLIERERQRHRDEERER